MDVVLSLTGLLVIVMAVVVILLPRVTTAGWAHGSMLRVFVAIGWLMAVVVALLLDWRTDWGFWPVLGVGVAVWVLAVGSRIARVLREADEAGPRRR